MKENEPLRVRHKEIWLIGIIGAAIGGGIGGYISVINDNDIYLGLGPIIGYIFGISIALFIKGKINISLLIDIKKYSFIMLCSLSIMMTIVSFIVFLITFKFMPVLGIIFFGVSGIYFFKQRKANY